MTSWFGCWNRHARANPICALYSRWEGYRKTSQGHQCRKATTRSFYVWKWDFVSESDVKCVFGWHFETSHFRWERFIFWKIGMIQNGLIENSYIRLEEMSFYRRKILKNFQKIWTKQKKMTKTPRPILHLTTKGAKPLQNFQNGLIFHVFLEFFFFFWFFRRCDDISTNIEFVMFLTRLNSWMYFFIWVKIFHDKWVGC